MASSCRVAALRFLKIRPRSVEEMRDKLSSKGYETSEVAATLEYLKEISLLNDRAFTASWIQYRLARPFGFRRIIVELKQKGIAEDIIASAVAQAKEEFSEPDQAMQLGLRRAERLGSIDPQKKKKRISDYLLRRGFPVDVVIKVIKNI